MKTKKGFIQMIWGFFSINHIITLILAIVIIVTLYFLLKNKSEKQQIKILGILSTLGIFAIIQELLFNGSPVEYLPLHLCSFNAMLLPIAVLTRNKTINNMLLLWSLGALIALILNNNVASCKIASMTFVTNLMGAKAAKS